MSDVSADLSAYTTLRLGGPARQTVSAANAAETVEAVRQCDQAGEPVLIIGGGSNLVVSDAGFPGTVVLVRSRGVRAFATGTADATGTGDLILTVEAGEPWDEAVAQTVSAGRSGLECLSGIPGSAGATPVQNVGAYGQEVAGTISSVRAYDRLTDQVVTLGADECGFGYRTSVFKQSLNTSGPTGGRWVVLSVDFRLTSSPLSAPIRYAELARVLDVPVGTRAPLARVREAVLALRAKKGMVLDQGDPDTWSAGSFFTNPVLDSAGYEALRDRAGSPHAWPGADGSVKVSAAWLIEQAGFPKGYAGRGVAISAKHTLALTNRGDGTTSTLLELAREIRDTVYARFGITLRPEPVLVGCSL